MGPSRARLITRTACSTKQPRKQSIVRRLVRCFWATMMPWRTLYSREHLPRCPTLVPKRTRALPAPIHVSLAELEHGVLALARNAERD